MYILKDNSKIRSTAVSDKTNESNLRLSSTQTVSISKNQQLVSYPSVVESHRVVNQRQPSGGYRINASLVKSRHSIPTARKAAVV